MARTRTSHKTKPQARSRSAAKPSTRARDAQAGRGKLLRIAVMGCGNVARLHIRGWQHSRLPVEFVALIDTCPDNARRVQAETKLPGARILTDYREVLDDPAVDVLEICSSSDTHTEPIIDCLLAGKHVLTEKPVGYSLEECRRLRWYRQQYPKPKVAVAYSMRYYPVNLAAKREIDAGTIGRPMFATVAHNHPASRESLEGPPHEHIFTDRGGHYVAGSDMTGATHPWDFARFILGEVADVFSFRSHDGSFATFRHVSGATSQVVGGHYAKGGLNTPVVLWVQGTRGTLVTYNVPGRKPGARGAYRGYVVVNGKVRDFTPREHDTGHGDITRCRNFHGAVTRGEPLICDMLEGIRTSELLHAMKDSQDHEIRVPVHQRVKTG